jgi:hypothetical protein
MIKDYPPPRSSWLTLRQYTLFNISIFGNSTIPLKLKPLKVASYQKSKYQTMQKKPPKPLGREVTMRNQKPKTALNRCAHFGQSGNKPTDQVQAFLKTEPQFHAGVVKGFSG